MPPNFSKTSGIGRLGTNRYDFEKHLNATDRRHTDAHIDLSADISGLSATTVHEALIEINNRVASSDTFVVVGDGYDVYATGSFNASAPDLNLGLNDVLYNTANPNYDRLLNGGLIIIKAGTYKISETVEIPQGISIMGEGFGTKLINTALSNPIFLIKNDDNRTEDRAVVSNDTDYDPFLSSKSVRLINFVISDNYLKPTSPGSEAYLAPNNTASPLISMERGAGLECDGLVFFGRTDSPDATFAGIATDAFSTSSYSTHLIVNNCSFDGVNKAVNYFTFNGTLDYLTFTNKKARIMGPISPSTDTIAISANGCNTNISNNYIWGDLDPIVLLSVLDFTNNSITEQNKSKIVICNNTLASSKADTTVDAPSLIKFDSAILADVNTYTVVTSSGNTFNYSYSYDAGVINAIKSVSATYTVLADDHVILVDTTSGPKSINLPKADSGRTLIIKDKGLAATNNITLVRLGGTGKIEGLTSNYIMNINYQTLKLIALSGDWWFV